MPTIDLHCNPNLYSDWKVKESSKLKHYDISSDDYGHPLTPARQRTLQQHINDYLNAYQTGCRIYDQITKQQIPNLESFLPLTKDGYLPQNRNICIWNSGIRHPFPEHHKANNTLQILIKPSCSDINPNSPDSIINISKDKTTGELWLTLAPPPQTIQPVLNVNGIPRQVQVQKTTYLKQENLIPGGIYQQKTGKDLLYLGHIQSTVYAKYQHSTEDYEPLGKPHETFAYLKINQTVENALASSHNIQEFFDVYSQACLAKHQELTSNISRCKHPKKLTAYLRQGFPIPNTTTVNFPVWDNISKTVTLVQATLKQI